MAAKGKEMKEYSLEDYLMKGLEKWNKYIKLFVLFIILLCIK